MPAAHLHTNDTHIILKADPSRPTSIDLSLELERQLEAESLPNSPNPPRPQSLDTNVLASIVTQLRLSLDEVSKERDLLAGELSKAQTREEGMRETLEHVTDKCIQMESDLELAANQRKEDEETIAMLRSKVEESRRALMRLQTEKRMSQVSNLALDLSKPPLAHQSLSGPPSSRRASFAPLTGSSAGRMGHRRISSVSDSGYMLSPPPHGEPSTSWPPTSLMSQQISGDPETTPTAPPSHNRRISLLFGRGAAPQLEPPSGEMGTESLYKQLLTLQQQLDDTKRELVESQEAHEASELCVRALRTFISENNVGVPSNTRSGTTAPPTASHTKQGSTASRWGFRLWTTGADIEPPNKASTPISTPTSTLPPDPGSALPTPSSQTAPSRKFGGFFSTRTSVSSNGSSRPPYDPVHQEPMYNGSDTSSLADSTGPVSPASELPQSKIGELEEKEELPKGKISVEIPFAAVE